MLPNGDLETFQPFIRLTILAGSTNWIQKVQSV